MNNPVSVSKFEVKSLDSPDEARRPSKTLVEVVRMQGFTLGRFIFEPGWRWSQCVKPVVKTDLCQASHVGYVVQGNLTVRMSDGTEKKLKRGDAYTIPPGHDAWVEGNEQFVGMEIMSAEQYARSTDG